MRDRDLSIDALKGFSIVLIGWVGLGYYFTDPILLWRVLLSTELPGFYVAAGFTVAKTATFHTARYFWGRAFWLFIIGGIHDAFIWGKFPWLYGEPLMMIALAMPLTFYIAKQRQPTQWLCFLGVILISTILQASFGYRDVQANQTWWWEYKNWPWLEQLAAVTVADVLRSFFIDGWSPLFPFLGHFIFGAWLAGSKIRQRPARAAVIALAALIVSGIAWSLFHGTNIRRFGYLEMSYPPVPAYVLFTCAAVFSFVVLFDILPGKRLKKFLGYFGRAPLACFLVVMVVLRFLIYPNFPGPADFPRLMLMFAILAGSIALTVFLLGQLRRSFRGGNMPMPLKIIFGGAGGPKQGRG